MELTLAAKTWKFWSWEQEQEARGGRWSLRRSLQLCAPSKGRTSSTSGPSSSRRRLKRSRKQEVDAASTSATSAHLPTQYLLAPVSGLRIAVRWRRWESRRRPPLSRLYIASSHPCIDRFKLATLFLSSCWALLFFLFPFDLYALPLKHTDGKHWCNEKAWRWSLGYEPENWNTEQKSEFRYVCDLESDTGTVW